MNDIVSHEWKVKIALGLIVGFSVISIFLFITIIILRFIRIHYNIRNTRFRNKVENHLNELLANFEDASQEEIEEVKNELRSIAIGTWQKELITDTLIYYNRNLTGDIKTFIISLFYEMDLHRLCLENLQSRNVRKQLKAMRYVSDIRYKPAWMEIIKDINHSRKLIRVEASLSLIFLTKNPLFFMDNLKFPLTEWQKINIYKKLQELPPDKIPPFNKWYENLNLSVRKFAIEMTAKFNQTEHIEELAALLKINPEEVKVEIIDALLEFEAFEYLEILMGELAKAQTDPLKAILVRAIGQFSTREVEIELLKPYLSHPVLDIRKEAFKAILKMENGKDLIYATAGVTQDTERMLRHITNPLLS